MSVYYDEDVEEESVVVDNGACWCRAGFAGEEVPSSTIRSLIGRYIDDDEPGSMLKEKTFVGCSFDDTTCNMTSLDYPIERGVIQNWDVMEQIWDFLFYEKLKIDPGAHNLVMSEAMFTPVSQIGKKAQVLFEKYDFPSFFLCNEGIMPFYTHGLMSGINLSIGEESTTVTAVYEGYGISTATQRYEMGGKDVTSYLQSLLCNQGYSFTTSGELELLRNIKEKYCFVKDRSKPSSGETSDVRVHSKTSYVTLPDDDVMPMKSEKWMCPEMLFEPSLAGLPYPGLHQAIHHCLAGLTVDLRKYLGQNIILTGATAGMAGFYDRMATELTLLMPELSPGVVRPEVPDLSCWVGLSIIGSMRNYKDIWMTKAEYEECGPNMVGRYMARWMY